ncbi:MAG: hypothetical protein IPG86_08530 [Chitinophagaceae bacterium]|nr:hypothetical protein [Chitinophagaceae bacterium]
MVREKEIDFKIRLKKGDATLFSYDLKGNNDQLKILVSQITAQAMDWIKKQSKPEGAVDNE